MYIGSIKDNREIAPDHFVMSIRVPEEFGTPLPGQFVMLRARNRLDPLLGRPLSVYAFEKENRGGTVKVLYRVVGKGTFTLSGLREGDELDLQGPLGTGFHIPDLVSRVVLIAGGIGVAPVTYLASHYRQTMPDVMITGYLGAKTSEALIGLAPLRDVCTDVIVTTDDGSAGTCGVVTDVLMMDLKGPAGREASMYACGPHAMMKCLADAWAATDLFCQVSLEERMACGVGACLGCAVALKKPTGESYYGRVCKDGPVFDIQRVQWDG